MEAPSPRTLFRRMAQPVSYAVLLILASLLGGMLGYHVFVDLPWIDAFVNTCMLLGGMGPVNPIDTTGGKVFAGLFALYSGLVFLAVTAFVLAPIFHDVLHRFHWETRAQK